jgi:hypothetical protein
MLVSPKVFRWTFELGFFCCAFATAARDIVFSNNRASFSARIFADGGFESTVFCAKQSFDKHRFCGRIFEKVSLVN